MNVLDLLIIGCGPAGLSAAEAARREELNYLVIEKGLIADTIYHYPVGRTVFSTPNELEFTPGGLRPCREKPTREELLSYYVQFALKRNLRINTEEKVESIEGDSRQGFVVSTSRARYRAARILVATGGMGKPRRLGIPGEERPKVSHSFSEPYPYVKKNVLVVGGGNSAAEATLFLAEEGAHTIMAIWRSDWENRDPKMNGIKPWVREPLEHLIEEGVLRLVLFREIAAIFESQVMIVNDEGTSLALANDAVFVLIGSDPDLSLIQNIGVQTVAAGLCEVPVYDPETFETNVAGIYVAGHFTRSRHIKEAIGVPRRIVPLIAGQLRAAV